MSYRKDILADETTPDEQVYIRWKTGERVLIGKMSSTHLLNAAGMCERRSSCGMRDWADQKKKLEKEIELRDKEDSHF